MKITKRQLRKIIKEELGRALLEQEESGSDWSGFQHSPPVADVPPTRMGCTDDCPDLEEANREDPDTVYNIVMASPVERQILGALASYSSLVQSKRDTRFPSLFTIATPDEIDEISAALERSAENDRIEGRVSDLDPMLSDILHSTIDLTVLNYYGVQGLVEWLRSLMSDVRAHQQSRAGFQRRQRLRQLLGRGESGVEDVEPGSM